MTSHCTGGFHFFESSTFHVIVVLRFGELDVFTVFYISLAGLRFLMSPCDALLTGLYSSILWFSCCYISCYIASHLICVTAKLLGCISLAQLYCIIQ